MTQDSSDHNNENEPSEPIRLTFQIDPSEFDEPRQLMWEKLAAEHGKGGIEELIKVNMDPKLSAWAMKLVNELWDSRSQIDVGRMQTVDSAEPNNGQDVIPDSLNEASDSPPDTRLEESEEPE